MNKIAVCPGSYDPVTVGHVDIIKRALKIFGSVEAVVMINPDKNYMFNMDSRVKMLEETFRGCEGVKVLQYSGMLYEYLSGRSNECVLVKGIRNTTDFEYERKMAQFNFEHSGVETMFLPADMDLQNVSSTLVKEKINKKSDFSDLIPQNIVKFFPKNL